MPVYPGCACSMVSTLLPNRRGGYGGQRKSVNGGEEISMHQETIDELPYPILHKITQRITTEVEGINRVLLDLTPKPVGTIEWE